VEAGLRSGEKYSPFPEEINRRLVAHLADLHFAPTPLAAANLRHEGVPDNKIHITGNTVIDALLQTVNKPCDLSQYGLGQVDWSQKVILMTCHRRENWGEPMRQIFRATVDILRAHPEYRLVFPLHKNPLVRELAAEGFADCPQAHLIEPLDYLPMCHVIQRSHLVLSDSGGLQEEAPALGKPVLVLRTVTERPEAVEAGTTMLAGTSYDSVSAALEQLIGDPALYARMAQAVNPYGDGHTSPRIVKIITAL
jgi:UDP-N-acetylglucosamine 2-epimerase (non-hydrolysing)